MKSITLDDKQLLEYIKTMLYEAKIKSSCTPKDLYHHNTSYRDAESIIRKGLLSLLEQQKRGICNYTEEELKRFDDTTSHVNGIQHISLAKMGLTDIYPNEDEYNSYCPHSVDILISKDIIARRFSIHYGNEFLAENIIGNEKFKSIDLRLLSLLPKENITTLLINYNYLRNIAQAIKDSKLDIPLRDLSSENITLDIDKISSLPRLELKNKSYDIITKKEGKK